LTKLWLAVAPIVMALNTPNLHAGNYCEKAGAVLRHQDCRHCSQRLDAKQAVSAAPNEKDAAALFRPARISAIASTINLSSRLRILKRVVVLNS